MEILIILFLVYLFFSHKEEKESLTHTERSTYTDRIFTFTNSVSQTDIHLKGDSVIFLNTNEISDFTFLKDGEHLLNDEKFTVHYSISTFHRENGKQSKYYHTISLNNIPIDGRITNTKSASAVAKELYEMTKGGVFSNSNVGSMFIVLASDLIIFNKHNKNRKMMDYVSMSDIILDSFIEDCHQEKEETVARINKLTMENLSQETGSDIGGNSSKYDIYLKILEFKSVHNINYTDIKQQYRTLAKKYHPDSSKGDQERFKLITEAYDYLAENYPK